MVGRGKREGGGGGGQPTGKKDEETGQNNHHNRDGDITHRKARETKVEATTSATQRALRGRGREGKEVVD